MFRILATTSYGTPFYCFTWRGLPETGIARAKADAKRFGVPLTDFRAETIQ